MMSREAVTRIGSWSINGWDFRLTIWQVSVYTSIERWTYLFLSFCVSCWRRLCAALRLHLLWFCFHFLQRDLQDASESCVFPLPGKDDNPWFTLNHCRISRRGVRMIVRVALQTCIPPVCLCRLILLALVPSNRCSWLLIMAELHWGHWFFRTFVSLPRGICGQSLCVHSSLHVFRRAWSGWFQSCWSCCGAAEVQAVAVF